MKDFIITTIIMTLTAGIFLSLLITASLDSLEGVKRFIVTAIIALAIGVFISGPLVLQAEGDCERWNEGVCPNCGEPWHLVDVEHFRSGDVLSYYACDKCQKVIEIHSDPY